MMRAILTAAAVAVLPALPALAADGAIKGVVKVKLPDGWKPTMVKIEKDTAECCRGVKGNPKETAPCHGANAHADDAMTVDPATGGLAGAVVYLTKMPEGGKRDWSFLKKEFKYEVNELAKPPTVVFDQKFCKYVPNVLIVPAGWNVILGNSDPIAHNVHTFAFKNDSINVVVPACKLAGDGSVAVRQEFGPVEGKTKDAEFVKVVCDIHPWMNAIWAVMEHPYVTVTDAKGEFLLDKVPPGTYMVKIYHAKFGNKFAGAKGLEVKVGDGETAVLTGIKELEVK